MSSFYSLEELKALGLANLGENVLISRKVSLFAPHNIHLSNNIRIDDFCIISGGTGITIGSYVHISAFVALFGGSGISIGDNCSISSFTAVYSESDDFSGNSLINPWFPKEFKPGYKAGKVVLMDYTNIGSHCVILPGVIFYPGAAVGANSVVVKNCDAWSIYSGSPAKKVKSRSQKLLALEAEFLKTIAKS